MKFVQFARILSCSAVLGLAFVGSARAADFGTAAEAEALVKKAVALIKSAGPDKAYDEITNGKSLKDRDLYIAVNDLNGKNLAHGANPKIVGKDVTELRDAEGRFPIKMMIEVAKGPGKGWTGEYKFLNPATQKAQTKVAYVERLGETLVITGIYKP
jgi:signal transduction histidine kinase